MEKISFVIPKNTNTSPKNTNTAPKNTNTAPKNNDNEYTKIAPNVYKFNNNITVDLDSELDSDVNDIYILYSNACELKKHDPSESLKLFLRCEHLISDNIKADIKYEIYINLALMSSTNNEINKYYENAINIYSDRAEPYYYWSIYCNNNNDFNKSYELLNKALTLSYDKAKLKYPNTQLTSYGKFLYDELSVTCYWLKKYDESKLYIEQIIDDPDFYKQRERLKKNLDFANKELSVIEL